MASLHPYLNFNDTCEAAFNLYRSVFGGEFTTIMRFKDVPGENPPPPEDADKIMHVALPVGNNGTLMGSDRPGHMGKTISGDSVAISVNAESEEEARQLFEGLSAGGSVTMPLGKQFWGALFGMLTDKYGIHWMVNYDYK
ncbi:VOC family protein [Chitinophaga sp.]|uniref:VOC family protein n=1 Tax=Chitinophaga sp. TaxID=1869181 RepID=UPI0031CE5656